MTGDRAFTVAGTETQLPDIYYLTDQNKAAFLDVVYSEFDGLIEGKISDFPHEDIVFGFSQLFHSLALTARANAISFNEMKQITTQWLTDLYNREIELHKTLRGSADPPEWISGKKQRAAIQEEGA